MNILNNKTILYAIWLTSLCVAPVYSMDPCSALRRAIDDNKIDIVQELVKSYPDMINQSIFMCHRWTPLFLAVIHGHQEIVEILIKAGADPNKQDDRGMTSLHWAAYFGHQPIVKTLIQSGAQLDIVDNEGWTALHKATSEGHRQIVKVLIAAGATINPCNKVGNTPLHFAVCKGRIKILRTLVEAGADLNAKNIRQITPLGITSWLSIPKRLTSNELLIDYKSRIEQAIKKAHKAALAITQAIHPRLGFKSPLKIVGQFVLKDICELIKEAEIHDACQPIPETRSWCIIS